LAAPPLLELWRSPQAAAALDGEAWGRALPAARHARLLARLGVRLEEAGVLGALPPEVTDQLLAARVAADASARTLRWEAGEIARALVGHGIPFLLIKGASYAAAGLALATGRTASDVDVLVAPHRLEAAEQALLDEGWEPAGADAGEERHMRAWLHQAPALRHRLRATCADLHHAVSPPKGQFCADTSLILAAARPSFWPACRVPCPADMVLISAVHLARETEIGIALRDLADFDALLRDFSRNPEFGSKLVARSSILGLRGALAFAARASFRLLGTPLPPELTEAPEGARLVRRSRGWLDRLVDLGLPPDGPVPPSAAVRAARAVLRYRALLVQMPLSRLALRSLRSKALRLSAWSAWFRWGAEHPTA
jgi:hypothetical protein